MRLVADRDDSRVLNVFVDDGDVAWGEEGDGRGEFNGVHAVATDSRGNIYVAEWGIGGRYEKLVKA